MVNEGRSRNSRVFQTEEGEVPLALDSLSPSSINKFTYECPRMWLNERLGKRGIATDERRGLYGKAVHNIMVIYFDKVGTAPSTVEIEKVAGEAFEEGKTYTMKGFGKRTNQILKNFVDFEQKRRRTWRQYKPTFVEKWLEAKPWAELPPFRNIVDFYCQADEAAIDWKTGDAEMSEEFMIQGKINEMTLNMNGYPCKRTIFLGLYSGRALTTPKVTEGWIFKVASRMVEMVKAGRFPKRQSPLCEYCQYILDCAFDNRCIWEGI